MKSIEAPERTERQNSLIADAAELAGDQQAESPLIGYIVIAFYGDGSDRCASWRPNREDHGIGETLFGAWAEKALAKRLAYTEGVRAAVDVLNGDA